MTRIYNHIFEESARLKTKKINETVNKRYFGKIIIKQSINLSTGETFITITTKEDLFNNNTQKKRLLEELSLQINKIITTRCNKTTPKIMVVGLGNDKVTADSLGSRTVDKLLVTSHLFHEPFINSKYGNLCAIKCGVSGITGIESFDVIYSLLSVVKPDILIAIDTLACSSTERLGNCVQISDNGIAPGSGANNTKRKLDYNSLHVPVIAIGVPLVAYVKTVLEKYAVNKIDESLLPLVITAKEIDFLIEDFSSVIANSINAIVHNKN